MYVPFFTFKLALPPIFKTSLSRSQSGEQRAAGGIFFFQGGEEAPLRPLELSARWWVLLVETVTELLVIIEGKKSSLSSFSASEVVADLDEGTLQPTAVSAAA
jgi:hypothetical protein